MNRKQAEARLLSGLDKALARLSFRKQGRRFSLLMPETFAVVEVQSDKYNSDAKARYTCNYGGGSRRYFDAHPAGFKQYEPKLGLFPFAARAGVFRGRDEWLELDLNQEDRQLDARIEAYLVQVMEEVERLVDVFSSDSTLLSWLNSESVFGISDFARERVVRVLSRRQECSE